MMGKSISGFMVHLYYWLLLIYFFVCLDSCSMFYHCSPEDVGQRSLRKVGCFQSLYIFFALNVLFSVYVEKACTLIQFLIKFYRMDPSLLLVHDFEKLRFKKAKQ